MNEAKMMVRGNLALQIEAQPAPRLSVVMGNRPTIQGHSRPSIRAVFFAATLLVAMGSICFGTFTLSRMKASTASNSIRFEKVKVDEGSSLWSLAEEHPAKGLTTQETSDLIRSKNHLTRGGLDAGSYLEVPVSR